jgi:nitrite reductase (NADH) small subunit
MDTNTMNTSTTNPGAAPHTSPANAHAPDTGPAHTGPARAGGLGAERAAQAWTPVCGVEDIPRAGARVVKRGGADDIAVFRAWDDHVFALLDRCPHKGGPLSAGLVHGHAVTCPLHGWTIDLADGRAQAPDEGCSHRVAARVEDGTVYLDLAGRAPAHETGNT